MPELIIQKQPKTARYFREQLGTGIELEMVLVEGGSFKMGSPETEAEHSDDEGPQHDVTVETFFLGRYPITQEQWQIVAETIPQVNLDLNPKPSHFEGNRRPVERVSWYEAQEYCARLSARTKRPYRLPTEAEWEFACRAGTATPFYFGKTLSIELANYDGNYTYGDGVTGEYREETTPVDRFKIANAWGLYDMHGNVWEWCQDHWHENYIDTPPDGSNWLTDNPKAPRVNRGGSWNYDPRDCRSAYRDRDDPGDRFSDLGFRVACSAPRSLTKKTGPTVFITLVGA
jgi:formylglycine-generating enzyme required for sulfatase activity